MAALGMIRLLYGNSYLITTPMRLMWSHGGATPVNNFEDAEAIIRIIEEQAAAWRNPQLDDALRRAQFCLETVRLKRKKHKQKWFSNWRTLNIDDERNRLVRAVHALEKRYTLICMGRPINGASAAAHDPPRPTHTLALGDAGKSSPYRHRSRSA